MNTAPVRRAVRSSRREHLSSVGPMRSNLSLIVTPRTRTHLEVVDLPQSSSRPFSRRSGGISVAINENLQPTQMTSLKREAPPVRGWSTGHLQGQPFVPLESLRSRIKTSPHSRPDTTPPVRSMRLPRHDPRSCDRTQQAHSGQDQRRPRQPHVRSKQTCHRVGEQEACVG